MPIYGQDMSENFLTVAAKFRFCSIFTDICSYYLFIYTISYETDYYKGERIAIRS